MPGVDVMADTETLHLPRILCLHGGGSNAKIFHTQCRVIRAHLKSSFRLCFVDAPFSSPAGPGIESVYEDYAPFYCWHNWKPGVTEDFGGQTLSYVEKILRDAMAEDDAKGATGKWVGILGFSQGAKTSASILMKQQVQTELNIRDENSFDFKFGVIMNGRGPLLELGLDTGSDSSVPGSSASSTTGQSEDVASASELIHIPTIHVHGRRDPGLFLHRNLRDSFFVKSSTRLVEWDGDHRLPIKFNDVDAVVSQICEVAKETGAL
ncbi:citrinin biosynthesis oxydoreductase CtnB [Nannizzia gypsea CBS 118893]|uniref:Citrinin biosynthesis oxydoreductase CtnB n=1 Tax=Arthroderma gypseum (strain ATCC MYA-4604 / CBS 118893) TaxID=535722 RepID=E4UU67_ARTGP|nr:citrinin biosynthesis oxydoreductase CtnB [Nannizzia gypsea CBS 118893]EFR00834.1 citrinin biosynthesis oxydoreductase CtnB [Nannizzia gypsea CBS 118893]